MDITLDSGDLVIAPNGQRLTELKSNLGARWDKATHTWRVPATSLNALQIVDLYGATAFDSAPPMVRALIQEEWGFRGFTGEERDDAEQHPSWDTLYSFQREAAEFLFCNPHASGLIGLSPGLGKTAVATVTADMIGAKRVLVLAPLTLARAWGAEIAKWTDRPRDVRRAQAGDRAPGPEVTIANHEVIQELILRDENGETFQPDWISDARKVKAWREEGPKTRQKNKLVPARERITRLRRDYLAVPWDLIIVDESVLLKNRKALKTDILATLRKAAPDAFIWELSGSPTTKHRDDLFRQLQIMAPRAFASYWRFAEFFCIVDKDGWGWTIEGDRESVDPHHYLRDYLFVRSQEEVLPELPDYIERDIPIDATPKQRKALDEMFDDWIVQLDEEDPDETVSAVNWLSRSTRLQQLTSNLGAVPRPLSGLFFPQSSAKLNLLLSMMKSDEIELPLLVWCWYIETANATAAAIQKQHPDLEVGCVTGRSERAWKEVGLQEFADGKLDVLVLQMGVGKYGHTFTDTKTVFYHDRTMDADAWVQSLRRVRRIGLQHRPVLIVPRVVASADAMIDANMAGKLPSIAQLTNAELAGLLRGAQATP